MLIHDKSVLPTTLIKVNEVKLTLFWDLNLNVIHLEVKLYL